MPNGSIPHGKQRSNSVKRHASPSEHPPKLDETHNEPSYEDEMVAQWEPALAVIPGRALTDTHLSPFQFRVLSLMCGYANRKDRVCWPKQETLAQLLGTNVQVISKIIAKLEENGYVEVAKSGFPARNVYRIIFDAPLEKPLATCLPATELSPQTSQSCLPRQVRVVSPDKSVLIRENRPLEQTIRTDSYSSKEINSTSLAQSAETAAETTATPAAPPERRTRESVFDPSALKRDPLYIALAQYIPEPLTYDDWREWAVSISRLHRAGASASEIPNAVKGHRLLMPTAFMTPRSIAKWWSQIREGKDREQLQRTQLQRAKQQARQAHDPEREARRERERAAIAELERELGIQ